MTLWEISTAIKRAERMGADEDSPEGARYIQISETLARQLLHGLATSADTISGLTRQVTEIRALTVGWTWAEACIQLDRGEDPREQEMPVLLERAEQELEE